MSRKILNFLAQKILRHHAKFPRDPRSDQQKTLKKLCQKNRATEFGQKFWFSKIASIADFQQQVPILSYDDFLPRIERMKQGIPNVAAPGVIPRFATSSGTTGGSGKFIPVTHANLKSSHFAGGKEIIAHFYRKNPHATLFQGKTLVIGGSLLPQIDLPRARVWFITAILQKNMPRFSKIIKEPSPEISFLSDRSQKIQKTIDHTKSQNITSITGSRARVLDFCKKALAQTDAETIPELRPNIQLVIGGGMDFSLHRHDFQKIFPGIPRLQAYNASEWFFAYQTDPDDESMLLMTNHGIFYEFRPIDAFTAGRQEIHTLDQIDLDREYVLLISSNTGLRRYIIGDTIRFTQRDPHKILVTGRTKYFIDLVGEEVKFPEVNAALQSTSQILDEEILEFTVGPCRPDSPQFFHERILEIKNPKNSPEKIAEILDHELQKKSSYYADERIDTKMLAPCRVHLVSPGTFHRRLAQKNKLGGQNKIPKILNNRSVLDEILK